jgi:hypothetical protein
MGGARVYERGQRIVVRDHHWEVNDVRLAQGGTLLELRRLSEGAGPPRTLTVVPALESNLRGRFAPLGRV